MFSGCRLVNFSKFLCLKVYITNNLSELAINRQCSRHHLPTRRQLPNGVQDDARRVLNAGIWLYQQAMRFTISRSEFRRCSRCTSSINTCIDGRCPSFDSSPLSISLRATEIFSSNLKRGRCAAHHNTCIVIFYNISN